MKAKTQGSVYTKIVAPAAMVVFVGALFYLGSTLLFLDEAAIDKTLTGTDLPRLDSPAHDASAKSSGSYSWSFFSAKSRSGSDENSCSSIAGIACVGEGPLWKRR